MGRLRPGASYIYERVDGRIYAREFGQAHRELVGYDHDHQQTAERRYHMSHINHVLMMCETDPAMRELRDQLFMLYHLKKTNDPL